MALLLVNVHKGGGGAGKNMTFFALVYIFYGVFRLACLLLV